MIFPLTENGKTTHYQTDAPIKKIVDAFEASNDSKGMKEHLSKNDYLFHEYRSGFGLNFDEK